MQADQVRPTTAQPRLTRRRFWGLMIVGISAVIVTSLVVVYVSYVRDVPLVISSETTVITEPLKSGGREVDYFAAAERLSYPPELATEDNGFRLLVQGLGVSPEVPPVQRRQIYEKLGLDPAVLPTVTYEQPYDFLMVYARAEETAGKLPPGIVYTEFANGLDERTGEPWTLEDLPMMGDWLDQNEPALDLIAEAVRKPVFCIPWARRDEQELLYVTGLADVQRMRSFVRGYAARARYRMGTGDVDGAIDDIVSCARLGRHLQNGSLIIECLVGVACEAIAYSIGVGSSLEHQPTEQQWLRLLDELNRLPARRPVLHSLEVERLAFLDAIQAMANGRPDPEFSEHLQSRAYGVDWNIVMRQANANFDDALQGIEPDRPDLASLAMTLSRDARSHMMGDAVTALLLPAMKQYQEARRRSLCKENLLRIGLAMLLYEKRHGTLPPAWSVDEQGNPLHSWRVLLLPYLGYDELYANIHLDEPWDSPHNLAFHAADVPIFQCPSASHGLGETACSVVEGPACAFEGGEGKRLDHFGPHSANLILVAERIDSICWMDPTQEIPYAEAVLGINHASTGLGSEHTGGMHIVIRSGAVQFISENIADESLQKLLDGTIEEPY